jgi:hypothetical protein
MPVCIASAVIFSNGQSQGKIDSLVQDPTVTKIDSLVQEPSIKEKLQYIIDEPFSKIGEGDYITPYGSKKGRELGISLSDGYRILILANNFFAIVGYAADRNTYVDMGKDGKLDFVIENKTTVPEEKQMEYIWAMYQATDPSFTGNITRANDHSQKKFEKLVSDAYKSLRNPKISE